MEFPRKEYWSGLPFPSLGDLPDPEIEPGSPALQAESLPSEPFLCFLLAGQGLHAVGAFSICSDGGEAAL